MQGVDYANQNLPLPQPPPELLQSSIESEVGLPIVSANKSLPKQSPAFNRLQPYIENSVPKPFVPNQANNSWRPVNFQSNSNNAAKPPELLNKFQCTDIDEIPISKLSSTTVSNPPTTLARPSAYLDPSPNKFGRTSSSKVEEPTTQLRDQLNRLLIDRQKQIKAQPIESNKSPSASVNYQNLNVPPKQHSLCVPSPILSKSGLNSGSISPLGSISSLGSAGSASSISPQSSASGARINSSLDVNRRRPSPLYQNSNEADVDYLTDLLVQGLNGKPKQDDAIGSTNKPPTTSSSSTFGNN
jgi:hypothetical protein